MRSVEQIIKSTQESLKKASGEGEKKAIQIAAIIGERLRRLMEKKEQPGDKQ